MSAKQQNKGTENSEVFAKQLFRQAWSISQQLDNAVKYIRNCNDLFHGDLIALRKSLRDRCEQILLLECSQRRKAEELLWKKVFYDVIQKCRQHKQQLMSQEVTMHNWLNHLSAASNYYSRLISKLESHYGLEVSRLDGNSFDVLNLSDGNEVGLDWLKDLFYRTFVYLGDIARYQLEIVENSLPAAISAYQNAIMIDPTKGAAFNQMAALMGDKNCCLDAVYYYLRSLSSPHPFVGAESNLKQIYEKNRKKLKAFYEEREGRTSEDDLREFVYQRLLLNFIHLLSLLGNNHSDKDISDVPSLVQKVESDVTECLHFNIQLLQECLSSKSSEEVSSFASIDSGIQLLLPCDLLLKLVALTMLTSHSLRLQGSSQTVSITTLALSLCSLVSKYVHDRLWLLLMHRLKTSSQNTGKTLLNYLLPESVVTTTPITASKELQPSFGSGKQKKKTVSKKVKPKKVNRRRRKCSNISSSESESEGEANIASDPSSSDESLVCDFDDNLSDREENVDLLDSLSDSDKEISHSSSHEDANKALTNSLFQKGRRQIVLAANFSSSQTSHSNLKETSQLESKVVAGKSEDFSQAVHNLCNILLQEDCFVIMKVFSDWLQAYPAVIATCSQSVPQLWSHLAQLLNILPAESQLTDAGLCDASLHDGQQVILLTEDIALRGFAPLVRCQEAINYTSPSLSKFDQAVTRLFMLHRLGQYLSNLKTAAAFSWNGTLYIGPAQKETQEADEQAQLKKKAEDEANLRRSKLMKTMAHLRLQTEVEALQQVQSTLFTPYLVPDASTLSGSLHIIKKLLRTEQFVIVIATAVIEMLDSMKKGKENYAIRDTIKFLEKELKSGNKFLHAQKPEETLHPEKKAKHDLLSWHLHSLLDCAIYFNNQQNTAGSTRTMVTVLLDRALVDSIQGGQVLQESQQKMVEMISHALQFGIDTDTAATFHAKWQQSIAHQL